MVVVADTSPINYLLLIGHVEVLGTLYGRVLVPSTVLDELRHPMAPAIVRAWAERTPTWVEVHDSKGSSPIPSLDRGESDAIVLATTVRADAILIDEVAGRREARRRGLRVAGTLAVLDEADGARLLNFEDAVKALGNTSFRVSTTALAEIRARRSR